MEGPQISLALAFLAGVVSFLSPCILHLVPGYVCFVAGLTLDELRDGDAGRARRAAVLHASLFALGFTLVFVTMGAAATAVGRLLNRSLPYLPRVGGALIALFGLYLLGLLPVPALARERRLHLGRRPAGKAGSVAVGATFAAGWTPCVGPVLGSILLYASLRPTVAQGAILLGAYALGMALPFLGVAAGFNWSLAGAGWFRRRGRLLERVAGAFLVLVGGLMVTGYFTALSRFLAGLGQLVNLNVEGTP